MFNGGVYDFGHLFLNSIGFAPYGVALAYVIKTTHLICAVLLLLNRYVVYASLLTIFILVMGIVLVHFKEGWFVVGGGRNGVEFNVLLISHPSRSFGTTEEEDGINPDIDPMYIKSIIT